MRVYFDWREFKCIPILCTGIFTSHSFAVAIVWIVVIYYLLLSVLLLENTSRFIDINLNNAFYCTTLQIILHKRVELPGLM